MSNDLLQSNLQETFFFLPPANEVWGKVIFLYLFVILFSGGSALVHDGIPPPSPPRTRHPPDQVHPGPGTHPGAEHAGRYGQRAGGTYPTGMQSCWFKYCVTHTFCKMQQYQKHFTLINNGSPC